MNKKLNFLILSAIFLFSQMAFGVSHSDTPVIYENREPINSNIIKVYKLDLDLTQKANTSEIEIPKGKIQLKTLDGTRTAVCDEKILIDADDVRELDVLNNHFSICCIYTPEEIEKFKVIKDDYINHFNHLLPAFRDKRYVRVNGKLVYVIYDVKGFKEVSSFIALWRKLANDNGLNDFYFIATDFNSENRREYIAMGFDAIHNIDYINIYHTAPKWKKALLTLGRKYLRIPMVYRYKDAIKYMIHPTCSERDVIPVIVPNWDHTPRSSFKGTVLTNSKPIFFKQHAKEALTMVKDKPEEERIVFLKSWNEWGEGNYMEPDYKFGDGYIKALSEAINEID